MKNTKKHGFTLAEVLIALLIMSLILIAAMPVITRKKRPVERIAHGAFACYWENGALVGRYLMGQKSSGGSTFYDAQEGRYGCYFTPPAGAKNFVVTTVGGGGGGASAGAAAEEAKKVFTATGANSYKVPFTGKYKMLIVGGGGGGGRADQMSSNPQRRACTGGQGGLVYISSVNLEKDDNLSIRVGQGGAGSSSAKSVGNGGSESYVSNKGGIIARAYGGGGGCSYRYFMINNTKSYIVGYNSSGNYYALGPIVGGANFNGIGVAKFLEALNGFYSATGGTYSIPSHPANAVAVGYNGSRGGGNADYYHQNQVYDLQPISQLNRFKSEFGIEFNKYERTNWDTNCAGKLGMGGCGNVYNFYGAGGGGHGKVGYFEYGAWTGGNGIVIIQGKPLYAGLGGYAGEVKQSAFADLPPKTIVFPGKGGKGGYLQPNWDGYGYTPRSVAPKEGEKSYVKNYAKTNGGSPAVIVNVSDKNTFSEESSTYGVSGGSGEAANIAPTAKPKGGAGGYSVSSQNGYVNNDTINGLSRPIFGNNKSIDLFNNLIGAGAGGGGGTSTGEVYTSTETSSFQRMQTFINNNLGKGGDGSSGVVFIQW